MAEKMIRNRIYIAYGSNLCKQRMRERCSSAKLIGKSELEGFRLCYKRSCFGFYLSIEESPMHSVPVGLWAITSEDEAKLDQFEGYPNYYGKHHTTINAVYNDGSTGIRTGFYYSLPDTAPFGLPTERYEDICFEGYDDFGFDENVLIDAFYYSEKMMSGEKKPNEWKKMASNARIYKGGMI